jgi:hypothetical protein
MVFISIITRLKARRSISCQCSATYDAVDRRGVACSAGRTRPWGGVAAVATSCEDPDPVPWRCWWGGSRGNGEDEGRAGGGRDEVAARAWRAGGGESPNAR